MREGEALPPVNPKLVGVSRHGGISSSRPELFPYFRDNEMLRTLASWTRWELGCSGPLRIRRETFSGARATSSILYASDLHLGHCGPDRFRISFASDSTSPARCRVAGGDLLDTPKALPELHSAIQCLAKQTLVAPSSGITTVCKPSFTARCSHFRWGRWLADEPLEHPLGIDGRLQTSANARILCTHYPDDFCRDSSGVSSDLGRPPTRRPMRVGHVQGQTLPCSLVPPLARPSPTRRVRNSPRQPRPRRHVADPVQLPARSVGVCDQLDFRLVCKE